MKLILVENEKDVENFYKKFGKSEEFKWIALSPFAIPELEKLNINYEIINDYYDSEELWKATGWNSYERVGALIKFVDNFIKTNMKEFKNIDVLNCYKHQLIMLFDGIISRIFMLKSLFNRLKPEKIYICKRDPHPFSGYGYLFNQNDTLWANCLSLEGCFPEISFVHSNEIITANLFEKKVTWKGLIKKIPGCSRLTKEYRSLQEIGFHNYMKRLFVKKRILLLESKYEWENTIRIFFENGFRLQAKSIEDLRKTNLRNSLLSELEVFISELSRENKYKEKFVYENVNFHPLLKSRVEEMIYEGITKGVSIYNYGEKYIQKHHPKAVLFSVAPYPEYWFLLQSFKKNRIPVICWQHGSKGFYNIRGNPETELLYTDYFFNYGKGVTETYSKFKREYSFQSFSTGSSTIDKLTNTKESGDYILYVTTNYYQNNLYFSVFSDYVDIKIYHIQRQILHYLKTLQDEKIIFKLHPNLSYGTPPLEMTKENIKIVRNEKSFTEILPNCKLIIIDVPSTVFLQSAITNKPIFCLTNIIKLKQEALSLMKKRAICTENPEELIPKLDDYLKTGNYPADVNNREFIKRYGTYLDDGNSTERAVGKVLEIIKENVN